MSAMACSIKGDVKGNSSPPTESGEELLDFQPLFAMKDAWRCSALEQLR